MKFNNVIISTTQFKDIQELYQDNSIDSKVDSPKIPSIKLGTIAIIESKFQDSDTFNIESFFDELCGSTLKFSETLFILHKSDIGFGSNYLEKLLRISDFMNSKFELARLIQEYDDNIIVFQHDSLCSPNVYKKLILNVLLKGDINQTEIFNQISSIYELLSKPWNKLLYYRNELILDLIPDSKLFEGYNLDSEFGFDFTNMDKESQINKIEEIIISSSINQISGII